MKKFILVGLPEELRTVSLTYMNGWEHLKQLLVKFMRQGSRPTHDHSNVLTKVIVFDSWMLAVMGLSDDKQETQLL